MTSPTVGIPTSPMDEIEDCLSKAVKRSESISSKAKELLTYLVGEAPDDEITEDIFQEPLGHLGHVVCSLDTVLFNLTRTNTYLERTSDALRTTPNHQVTPNSNLTKKQ